MQLTTLCFCIKDNTVLLAMKKRGFGVGKWNGYGGKVKQGETPRTAIVRELKEESGLSIDSAHLYQSALVHFYFDEVHVFDCFVYLVHEWRGEPIETEEMRPQWYDIMQLPFSTMWAADREWVPRVLAGEKIEVSVYFNGTGTKVKQCKIRKYT